MNYMRIVIIGKSGQLAQSLSERFTQQDGELIYLGRPELDLLHTAEISKLVYASKPNLVINAAAYTGVDQAEDHPKVAMQINAEAPGIIAQAARLANASFVHISTDYVYSGSKIGPYYETDPVDPLSVYGQTKLAGEHNVLRAHPNSIILRTSWIYSPFGRNFVRTILDLAKTRDRITVVNDQFGSPTSAIDLAEAICVITRRWLTESGTGTGQIYHVAGLGKASWCEFARHVLKSSDKFGGPTATVIPLATKDWPTKAVRPKNSRLDTNSFFQTFGWRAPDWRTSVEYTVRRLLQNPHS